MTDYDLHACPHCGDPLVRWRPLPDEEPQRLADCAGCGWTGDWSSTEPAIRLSPFTPERIVSWYHLQHLGPWSSESWSRLRWLGRYAQLQAFKFHGRPPRREHLQPPEPRPSFAGMRALSALDAGQR